MTGSSVSAVTAYTAHREWASRPPDERYASVHALYEAARARHARIEERPIETGEFRTEAIGTDDLVDWNCRISTPPRRTRWRKSTRRIPAPSGATCRG